ncbi:MAG: PilT/PilU family type 4a pilus ATPase [Rudaea sp.]
MNLSEYLQTMADQGASDLFLSVGAAPAIKVEGETRMLDAPALDSDAVAQLADAILDEEHKRVFDRKHEMNLTLPQAGTGRFRVNLYRQRGETGIAIRYVPESIPTIESLNLPAILEELIMRPRGLVLVVGATGSGKSSTLAAMIDYRSKHRSGHILTIEDPIEFVHQHGKSIVDQREVGFDTNSYADALQNALRESPDVVMIGEIRDRETMQQALIFAETGQLCLATLQANNAAQALDRIVGLFPDSARKQVLMDLSLNLQAVVSQRLLRRSAGGRRLPAVEVLLHSRHVSDLILKGEIDRLKDAMKQGLDAGMMTFEESLLRLYQAGKVSLDEALDNADSRSDLALRVRLSEPLEVALQRGQPFSVEPSAVESPTLDPGAGLVDDRSRRHRV